MKRLTRINIVRPLLTLLVCASAILLSMLTASPGQMDFEMGHPWLHAPIVADFNFDIKIPDEVVEANRDSIRRTSKPYFDLQPSAAASAIAALRSEAHSDGSKRITPRLINHAASLLSAVYERGIIDGDMKATYLAEGKQNILVVDGVTGTTHRLSDVLSPREAYEYLMTADTIAFRRADMALLDLGRYLTPNLRFNREKTQHQEQEDLKQVATIQGHVYRGERIIDRGELLTATDVSKIASYIEENSKLHASFQDRIFSLDFGGKALIVLSLLGVMMIYLYLFRYDLFESRHSLYLLFALVTAFPIITNVFLHNFISVYMIPFAMTAIFARIFTDTRTAFMTYVVMLLLSTLPFADDAFKFILTELIAGLVAIYTLKELSERAQLLRTALNITLAMMAIGFAYDITRIDSLGDLSVNWYTYIVVNGVALLFAYPLMYLIERLFGFTSTVTLVELNNINSTVLRKMSKVAPGTFIHSMQVANLAAEVADRIGAKAALVRTGALYHDIGKMLNAPFFTENQSGVNPHDQLTEKASADIIIDHVRQGLHLAERYHLPRVIREFIETHHGRSLVRYFYLQSVSKHGEEQVAREDFTYPGRNPFTREQAILMMADAVEAASRSLKVYSEDTLTELVDRIIDKQVEAGYFRECPITYRDIAEAKRVFVESLKVTYHTRIAYPDDKPHEDDDTMPEAQKPKGSRFIFGTGMHWG